MNLPNQLPPEWVVRTLKDSCKLLTDGSHFSPTPRAEGRIMVNVKDIVDGNIDYAGAARISEHDFFLLERNNCVPRREDVLFSKDGTIGRVVVFRDEEPVAVLSSLAILRAQDDLNPDFLAHVLRSHHTKRQIEILSSGSALKRIVLQDLAKLAIPMPVVLEEQALIAAILDTVDDAIRYTELVIAKLKQVRAGLLHDLLTYGIDENGDLRDPVRHPEQFKESELGLIPREWEVSRLGTVANVRSGVTLGRDLSGSTTVELPYLRVFNVQDGFVDLSDVKTIKVLTHEVDKYRLEAGDVLMNEGGDFDKLGRGTVWLGQIEVCLHQNHVFRVRSDRARLSPHFLASVSSSNYGKRFFVLSSKQSTNLASINSSQLNNFPIPIPLLAEQDAITRVVDVIDSRLSSEAMTVSKFRLLKQGLMDDLLTGRVRVVDLLSAEE